MNIIRIPNGDTVMELDEDKLNAFTKEVNIAFRMLTGAKDDQDEPAFELGKDIACAAYDLFDKNFEYINWAVTEYIYTRPAVDIIQNIKDQFERGVAHRLQELKSGNNDTAVNRNQNN